MSLTNPTESRFNDGIVRREDEVILTPSSLKATQDDSIADLELSENTECSDKIDNATHLGQKEKSTGNSYLGNIDNGHVRNIDNGHVRNIDDGHIRNIDDGHIRNIDDGYVRNIDDVHVRNIDDVPVRNIDYGHVRNIDNGHVRNIDDGHVRNVDDEHVRNIDDGHVRNVDDGQVRNVDIRNIEDGHVRNVDDGHVRNVDDGHVRNIDNGHVRNVDDGHVRNIDDEHVRNIDERHVKNIDDGHVRNVDDGHVRNIDDGDDGRVRNIDDGLVIEKEDAVVIHDVQNHILDQHDQVNKTFEAKGIRKRLSMECTSISDMKQTKATSQIKMYAKLEDDKYACKIVGMCTTRRGLVLLADLNNNKLKIFTTTNIPLSSIAIPRGPLSVALMDETTAVVGRQDKYISVIDISDEKSLKVTETIKLPYKIMGLATYCGNIVITTLDKPKSVKMLNLTGEEVWSVTADLQGRPLFEAPEYVISPGVENELVVVTDYLKETLSFISCKDGTVIKTLDMQGNGPEGIASDNHNNLFVAYFDRNEIACISENGRSFQTVLSGKSWGETLLETFAHIRSINCGEDPLALAYNCFTNELLVSYNPSDCVDRFALKME